MNEPLKFLPMRVPITRQMMEERSTLYSACEEALRDNFAVLASQLTGKPLAPAVKTRLDEQEHRREEYEAKVAAVQALPEWARLDGQEKALDALMEKVYARRHALMAEGGVRYWYPDEHEDDE